MRFRLSEQPLDENPQSEKNEDDTAGNLCFFLEPDSETASDEDADKTENKGGAADDGAGREDGSVDKGKGYADCQCINAGGYRQRNHGRSRKTLIHGLFGFPQCFPYHVDADERQNGAGKDAGDRSYDMLQPYGKEIADERHQKLEAAEVDTAEELVAYLGFLHCQSLADGDGKSIHGQADCDHEDFNEGQGFYLRFERILG